MIGTMIIAESNLYFAVKEASTAETDGEIQAILHEYGFRIHIYEEITPEEKVKALFRPFIKE
jgi:hypothetical protein